MDKKILFISTTDLADTDSNGRTLRDVFGFFEKKNIFCFCTHRKNKDLDKFNAFCVDESKLYRFGINNKTIHRNVKDTCEPEKKYKGFKNKKNPLTCLLRIFLWNFFWFIWKNKFKKWVLSISPDYIVYNPGDFPFMHKLATWTSKILKKKLIVYNTEDYYFKTWNYLHDDRGFKFLYPTFRRKLRKSFDKMITKTSLFICNIPGLTDLYSSSFPNLKCYTCYHSSSLKSIDKETVNQHSFKDFYYAGDLGKGRDETLMTFSKKLSNILPDSKIYVNGTLGRKFTIDDFKNTNNIIFKGFCSYQEVSSNLLKDYVLLNLGFLNEYDAKDKRYGFSTKLGDYISSGNLIIHFGLECEESRILNFNKLAFVADNEEKLVMCLKQIKEGRKNPFYINQLKFKKYFLDRETNNKTLERIIYETDF